MNLSQFREKHCIKRIDFSKVKRSGLEDQCETDALRCPYCKALIELCTDDYDEVLRGSSMQCPTCDKWFYATAEISIETTCIPISDAVIDNKRHIETTYQYMDECDEKGVDFSGKKYGIVEWEIYKEFARPLFENEEKAGNNGSTT